MPKLQCLTLIGCLRVMLEPKRVKCHLRESDWPGVDPINQFWSKFTRVFVTLTDSMHLEKEFTFIKRSSLHKRFSKFTPKVSYKINGPRSHPKHLSRQRRVMKLSWTNTLAYQSWMFEERNFMAMAPERWQRWWKYLQLLDPRWNGHCRWNKIIKGFVSGGWCPVTPPPPPPLIW